MGCLSMEKSCLAQSVQQVGKSDHERQTSETTTLLVNNHVPKWQGFLHPIRTWLTLSVVFHLSYLATNGLQNLQSSVNDSHALGVFTLAVMYGTIFLSGTFGLAALRIFGYKRLLLLALLIRALYVGANFYASFPTLLPAAFLVGVAGGYIGPASFTYTKTASDSYVVKKNLGPERHHGVLSIFFGVFFTFFEASQVTGNLLSSLVLHLLSDSSPSDGHYESDYMECGTAMCSARNASIVARVTHPKESTMNVLIGVFLVCALASFLVAWLFLPEVHEDQPSFPVSRFQEVKDCFKMLQDPRLALMTPLFMSQAMVAMIIFTGFTDAYVTCAIGVDWVGYVMMTYGMSTAIFATAANLLARYLGRRVLITTFILIDCVILLTLLLWSPGTRGTKAVLFTIAGLAGISEGISQPQFDTFLSIVFKDNSSVGFVVYTTAKSFSMTVTLLISAFACTNLQLYIALTLYALGFIGYVSTETIIHYQTEGSKEPLPADSQTQHKQQTSN